MNEKGILLFGGTFDPIHNGHLIISRSAAEQLGVQKIILIPSAVPPHKQNKIFTEAEIRLEMVHRAVEGDALFEVSDCELHRQGPSYTLDTVRYFHTKYGPELPLYWLIGADSIPELPGWYHIQQLVEECTLVTAGRPGSPCCCWDRFQNILDARQIARLQKYLLATPLLDISATDIRRRVPSGLSIRYLVPEPVRHFIRQNNLYVSFPTGRQLG
ncbi:MAG: Nicotinate-nucleotide adenylyltransferase [Planctomycetes bacterium ADurb.Bin412]|nr:MAG: Nicotinate-nucleotide adenylyltransferase [Planctomycetes bacterium ADurb.Bin412]